MQVRNLQPDGWLEHMQAHAAQSANVTLRSINPSISNRTFRCSHVGYTAHLFYCILLLPAAYPTYTCGASRTLAPTSDSWSNNNVCRPMRIHPGG